MEHASIEPRKRKEKDFHNKSFDPSMRERTVTGKFYAITQRSAQRYQALIAEHCLPGMHVLDYGCGPGTYSGFIAERGARITGIDISETAIAQAGAACQQHGYADRTEFLVMDAEALEFADNTFDVVCGSAILHHLDVHRAFREIARTLKPEGCAFFIEGLGHNPLINLYRARTPRLRTEDEHPLLMDEINVARNFFGRVEVEFFHLASLGAIPFVRTPLFKVLLPMLETVDMVLLKGLPFLRKHAWISVITLRAPREHPR